MEQEAQINPIEDLVNYSLNQDYNKANQIFGDLMGEKIADTLEQEKIKVANAAFNGYEEPTDDESLDTDMEAEVDMIASGETDIDQSEADLDLEINDEESAVED